MTDNSTNTKRKAPAFQFYADNFLAGTADMTAEEVGGYVRLLCHQWTKGGIPNDEDRAGRMAGLMGSPSLRYVLAKFSPCDDGMLRNERMERIRSESEAHKAKQSASGRKGAEKRWSKWLNDGDPNGDPNGVAMATPIANEWPNDSSPSPSPSPSNTLNLKNPHTPLKGGEEFEQLRARIGGWFNRRESTVWTSKEIKALKAVLTLKTPPEDIDALETRYLSGNPYLRRDILTLLNNWNTEIDRAKSKVVDSPAKPDDKWRPDMDIANYM
jgi:uncharacterized protein YdaU (DUF1376 family)